MRSVFDFVIWILCCLFLHWTLHTSLGDDAVLAMCGIMLSTTVYAHWNHHLKTLS